MTINFEPTPKQFKMLEAFEDANTTELLFGGSAGSSKSYGICALILLKCLQHPGIRIGLARNELTTLKKTTIISLFEVANNWGITDLFNYNSTAGIIKFNNTSEIILQELRYLPSDNQYNRLGGQLFTFGVIDEVGEVDEQGFNVFKSRLGRWKNDELKIKPIVLMTCNPTKGWLYNRFYQPHKTNELKPYQKFIQALPTDNKYLSKDYINNLMTLPTQQRERLLYGNWDYEQSDNQLLNYEQIQDIYKNIPELADNAKKYITADIAFTSDKCVIMVWSDLIITQIYVNPSDNVEDFIIKLAKDNHIPMSNISYDSDGVGQFLKKRLIGAKPIVNNARALYDENFKNLKTQLYYKLVDVIKDNRLKVIDKLHSTEISEELGFIHHKPTSVVGKLEMVDKGEVKRMLGRSPDFSDAMAYRMIWELKPKPSKPFKIM